MDNLKTAIASLKLAKNFLKVTSRALASEGQAEYKSILEFCSAELLVAEQSLKKILEDKENVHN